MAIDPGAILSEFRVRVASVGKPGGGEVSCFSSWQITTQYQINPVLTYLIASISESEQQLLSNTQVLDSSYTGILYGRPILVDLAFILRTTNLLCYPAETFSDSRVQTGDHS